MHARKFAKCNGLLPTSPSAKGWTPTKGNFIPAKEHLTNDNLEEFFVQCWEDGSKPNVTQGRRYINHILTHHGEPTLNKHSRQKYAPVLDVLAGLKREEKWRNHTSLGAKPLSLAYVKKILMAPVHDHAGNLDLLHLRNKTLAACLILCGWHQKDAWEIVDKNVINLEDHHDRDGHHRPKFLFSDLCHNKRRKYKVCNTIGCGCKETHLPKNSACPYNLLLWYQQVKEECDDRLTQRKAKLSRKERLKHFDENGHLKDRHFFRSITKKGYEHRNMGQNAIRGVFEYWRIVEGLGKERLTADMARKTFCTLGKLCTGARKKNRWCISSFPPSSSWTSPTTEARTSSRRTSSTRRGATRRRRPTRRGRSRCGRRTSTSRRSPRVCPTRSGASTRTRSPASRTSSGRRRASACTPFHNHPSLTQLILQELKSIRADKSG